MVGRSTTKRMKGKKTAAGTEASSPIRTVFMVCWPRSWQPQPHMTSAVPPILRMAREAKSLAQRQSAGQWQGAVAVARGRGRVGWGTSRSVCPLSFLAVPSQLWGASPWSCPCFAENVLHLCLPYTAGSAWSPAALGLWPHCCWFNRSPPSAGEPTLPLPARSSLLKLTCGVSSGPVPLIPASEQPQWNLSPFQIPAGPSHLLHLSAWRGKTKVWSGAWTLEPGCLCPNSGLLL